MTINNHLKIKKTLIISKHKSIIYTIKIYHLLPPQPSNKLKYSKQINSKTKSVKTKQLLKSIKSIKKLMQSEYCEQKE